MGSTKTLKQILTDKSSLSREVTQMANMTAEKWGCKVQFVDLNDICLPSDLLASLAGEAQARREAAAKVIAAKGDFDSAECLSLAADQLNKGGDAALTLKFITEMHNVINPNTKAIVMPMGGINLMSSSTHKKTKKQSAADI